MGRWSLPLTDESGGYDRPIDSHSMSIHLTRPSSLIGVLGAGGLFLGLNCLAAAGKNPERLEEPAAREADPAPPAILPNGASEPNTAEPIPTANPDPPPAEPAPADDKPTVPDVPPMEPGAAPIQPVWPQEAAPYPALPPAVPGQDPFATPAGSNSVDYSTSLSPPGGVATLAVRPSGFDNIPPEGFRTTATPLMPGLNLTASLAGTYDSNASQGIASANHNGGQGDFYLTLGGTAAYQNKGRVWTFTATYAGGYNEYFKDSNLSGYFQNAGASLTYDAGGRLSATLSAGVDYGSGANRYYQAVVNQVSYNYMLATRYAIAPKTSLVGSFSQSFTDASGGSTQNTRSTDVGLSALWRCSALTEIGPGVRYTSRSGDAQQDRTTVGPTVTVNHKFSPKFSLNSQIGVDFVNNASGGSTSSALSALLAATYQASDLWGMNLSLYRDTQADPSGFGGFTEVTAVRLGYQRKIQRATLNLGVSYESDTFSNSNLAGKSRPNERFLSLDASLSMPVFANTCDASIFMRYRDQNGGPSDSWNSFMAGARLSHGF